MTSIALRWAIVTSQPRTLLSGRSRGYARSAETNVSAHASSASAGPSSARHTRITTGPCSATISSNGRTVRSTLAAPEREVNAERWLAWTRCADEAHMR